MKTVFSNSELVHVGASQSQQEGRNSNGSLFFEGATIYSYGRHFSIARFVAPGVVLFNGSSYSNTTAKHQSDVRRAVRHCRVLELDGMELDDKKVPALALDNMTTALKGITERTRSESKIESALNQAESYRQTAIYFGATVPELPKDKAGIVAFVAESLKGKRINEARNVIAAQLKDLPRVIESDYHKANQLKARIRDAAKVLAGYGEPLPRGTQAALKRIAKALPELKAAHMAALVERAMRYARQHLAYCEGDMLSAHHRLGYANDGLSALKPVFMGNNLEAVELRKALEAIRDTARAEIAAEYADKMLGIFNDPEASDRELTQARDYYNDRDPAKCEALQARIDARHGEKIAAWRRGESTTLPRDVGPLLRLAGQEIVTSWGARVPVSVAPDLWRLVGIARAKGALPIVDGMKVGIYRLTEIKADGGLVVGCHDIAYSELEFIAKELGFIA